MDVASSASASASASDNANGPDFKEENNENDRDRFTELFKSFMSDYHVASIKSPFGRHETEHYTKLTSEVRQKQVEIIGDGLVRLTDLNIHYRCSIIFLSR